MYSTELSGLGVLSNPAELINYLINGYVDGLTRRVPDSVNLYTYSAFHSIVTDGVTAAVAIAVNSSTGQVIPRDLLSELKRRFQNRYPLGDPYVDAFNYTVFSHDARQSAIRHINLIASAVWDLTLTLLADWVPPVSVTTPVPGTTVGVDTVGAQASVAASSITGAATTNVSGFLQKYGMYVAGSLLLLLVFDKGK